MSTNISCYRVFGLKLGKEKGIPVFWFPWHAHRLYDGSWENFGDVRYVTLAKTHSMADRVTSQFQCPAHGERRFSYKRTHSRRIL